ncbi:MAG: phosphotransferase, partial [Chitinophagia bacterium]|nr:phosphotransferase [Chitinophagia bacterium]
MTNKSNLQIAAIVEKLFFEHFDKKVEITEPLPLSGSDRRYFRLSGGGHTVVAVYNTNIAENNTFLYLTELFRKNQVPVAEVYAISKDRRCYLQQDLGRTS